MPVVVIFDTQPQDAFDLRSLGTEQARAKMQDLARREQRRARSYLDRQRRRGRADDVRTFWSRNAMAVRATPGTIRELAKLPNVERIVYDQQVTPLDNSTPESLEEIVSILSEYGNLTEPAGFEHSSTGERAWGVEYVGADDVQEHGVTGAGVNVSVVDTGIDESHPALEGQVTKWKDFTGDNATTPTDPYGHGTHVAGTIAGKPNSSYAVGVAPGASLYGAKVFSKNEPSRISDLLAAFDWSANESADVISASVGIPPLVDSYSGDRSTGTDGTATLDVPIYTSANGTTSGDTSEAYEPAYVMVVVEPEAINGSAIENRSRMTRVMNNSTVTLSDPGGSTPLTQVEADWAYRSGEVPSAFGFYKFKPGGDAHIAATGNWSLNVTYANGANVTYEVVAAPVYPTNGTDELAASLDTIATSHGVVPVVAAGNYGSVLGNRTVSSPGAAEHAITVGASKYKVNDVARFSSRGPVAYGTDTRPGIDIIAPGVSVLSTYPTELTPAGYDPYAYMSGTSMATPHVSGTVALMLDAEPSLNRSQVEGILERSAQSIPAGQSAVGAGMLDAWAAVNASNSSALSANASTEAGIHELHAGLGDTASDGVVIRREPVTDSQGDAGSGPDLRASSRRVLGTLEIATFGDGPANATARVYLDVDRTNSTGDTGQSGAEYLLVLERTFDGSSYGLVVETYAYNASTDAYESTTDLSAHAATVNGELLEVTGVDLDPDPAGVPDWHVTVAPTGGSVTDRLPDSGQVTATNTSVKAVAVAWNASAGTPDSETAVSFRLYDSDSGELVGNRTIETAHDGTARTTFSVPARYERLYLELTDTYGNTVAQHYRVSPACVEWCLTGSDASSGLAYDVAERQYEARANETVTLTIPIYNGTDMSTYNGSAAVQLSSSQGTTTVNYLTVSEGILSLTVDLSNSTLDDVDGTIDVRVALTKNYSSADSTASAGSIDIRTDVVTRVAPRSAVVQPGGSVTMSFQHARYDGTPVNDSTEYVAIWITDRTVQAFARDLPRDTLQRLERRLEAARRNESTTVLTARDRAEIREAARNVSTEDTSYTITTGTADPTAKGVGTFQVSPPSDARYGFVFAMAANGSSPAGYSLVLVDDRIRPYADNQTEPTEESRYDLDVRVGWDDWGQHRDGDYMVPNETYTVHVSLYDRERGTYVDDAKVTLYSVTGETVTVRTSGDGPVSVDLSAPDVDWKNASWQFRYQEVLGIAHGYHDADGTSVSETEVFYGDVDRVESSDSVVNPLPSLAYDNGTVTVTIDYENESWADVPGEKTLVILRSARRWQSTRDLFVDYVDPGSNSTYTLNVTDSQPPATDRGRTYAVDTQSTSMDDDARWMVTTSVEGASVQVTAPPRMTDEATTNVTLTVRDRNGTAVEGAVVVWSYVLYGGDGQDTGSLLPPKIDGRTFVGTTGPNGTVTFQVAPDIPENTTGSLAWDVSFATENASRSAVQSGTVGVVQAPTVTLSGTVTEPDGTPAGDDTVAVFTNDGGEGGLTRTNATGGFSQVVHANYSYDVQFYQGNADVGWAPRDGVVDMSAVERLTASNDTDIGTTALPTGHVVNVTVVNESGSPVGNASIEVVHEATDGATAAFHTRSASDGMLHVNGSMPGLELAGNVTVRVRPPANGLYNRTTYVRNITVSSSRNLTVQLNESGNVTVAGTVLEADGDPAAVDRVRLAEQSGPLRYETETDDAGSFAAVVGPNTTYALGYAQDYPRAGSDGSPDLFVLGNVTVGSTGVDTGTVQLPDAHRLNLTVVNQIGFPVHGANVSIAHVANNTSVATGWLSTTEDGHVYYLGTRGVELNGTARVVVRSPDGGNETVRTVDLGADRHLTVQVNTSEGTEPVANVSANATRVNVSEPVGFDASDSLDDVGIVAYNWTFGDGTEATGATTSHRFADLGTYTVTVTVADADGQTDTSSVTVEVVDEINPTISDASVNTTDATVSETPVEFSVAASDNHNISRYAWDFDGDGTVDQTTTTSVTTHVYSTTGTMTPSVTVLDESGNARAATFAQVNVTSQTASSGTDGSSGSGGGGGGGGGGGDEGSASADTVNIANGAAITVRDAKIGSEFSASIAGMVGDGTVTVEQIDFEMRFADDMFIVRVLGPSTSPPDGVRALRGGTAIRYLRFKKIGLASSDFDQATVHFTVDSSALPDGASPSDVALFRLSDGEWTRLNTKSQGNGRYVATTPGFSVFAVGVVSADIAVTDVSVPSRTVTVGETATVKVTLENVGGKAGTTTVRVKLGGTVVAEQSVSVPAGGSKTVSLSFQPTSTGTFEVAVGGTGAGKLTVEPGAGATDTATGTAGPDGTTSTSTSSPGFGWLVALLALLGAVALRKRRAG